VWGYNQYMQNSPSTRGALTPDQRAFVEDMGQHMVGWGLPRTSGRMYAYLLLQDAPVGLDRLSADLGVARSGASVATRQLVHCGLARATGAGGTRRLVYQAHHDLSAIFAARDAQTRALTRHLRAGAALAAPGPGRERLAEMAEVMDRFLEEVQALLARFREGGRPR